MGDAIIPGEGHIHQKLSLQHKVRAFGSHALCSDFLRLSQVQCANIGEWQHLTECMNCSPLGRGFGEEGPKLAEQDYNYIYRGPEQVMVKAGTFDCHKFEWTIKNGAVLEMWTTEEDFLPVRMVSPTYGHIYDLVELSERQI